MTTATRDARLEIDLGPGDRRTIPLERAETLIGRDQAADIVLDRRSVSRRHAIVEAHPDGFLLVDTKSAQGTYLNNRQISEEILRHNDRILIGDVTLVYIEEKLTPTPSPAFPPALRPVDSHARLVDKVHAGLIEENRRRREQGASAPAIDLPENARRIVENIVFDLRKSGDADLIHVLNESEDGEAAELGRLVGDVLDAALRYGPLQPFIEDPMVEEIMVNGPGAIYVKRRGVAGLERSGAFFLDEQKLRNLADGIVRPLNREINEIRSMIDGRLPDGSRVNVIIPPLSRVGTVLTIRKFPEKPFDPKALEKAGTLDQAMRVFLELAVRNGQNIVISGGTASGKTTLLNAISSFIPTDSRIITIEDSAELQLLQPHVVGLESRLASMEDGNAAKSATEVTIRDLVRNALRMRPDRIIVGECRGGEAIDMLQAMNTGHMGSMTTGHSNGALEMLARLETMCLTAGIDIPIQAVREQIARAIDLLVHIENCPDGVRRVTEIVEVECLDGGSYVTHQIYRFDPRSASPGTLAGRFVPCGRIPAFILKLYATGEKIPTEIFGGIVHATKEED